MKEIFTCFILCVCCVMSIINKWEYLGENTIPAIETPIASIVMPYYHYLSSSSCCMILCLSLFTVIL